jgi:hypothetical protein
MQPLGAGLVCIDDTTVDYGIRLSCLDDLRAWPPEKESVRSYQHCCLSRKSRLEAGMTR